MKKTLIILALVSILIPSFSMAEESTTTKQKIEQIKEKRESIKDKIRKEKEEIEKFKSTTSSIELKEKTKDIIEQRIGKKFDEKRIKIASGFEEVIENLKNLLTRVETRISNIENKNTISTTTKELVSKARNDILLAEEELTIFENKLSITTSSSTKKTYLEDLKTQSEKTKKLMKIAHKTIVDIINSLKPGLEKSTSTEEIKY